MDVCILNLLSHILSLVQIQNVIEKRNLNDVSHYYLFHLDGSDFTQLQFVT